MILLPLNIFSRLEILVILIQVNFQISSMDESDSSDSNFVTFLCFFLDGERGFIF